MQTASYPSKLVLRVIIEWVDEHSSVLDLGCGNGELSSLLTSLKHVRAQGIEVDQQAIYECVARGLSVLQQNIDTGLSEYADKSLDYVILHLALQEVKNPNFVLQEALRVGKKVIVSFPNFAHYVSRFQIFFKGKVPVTRALPFEWYNTPNLHFLSISDFVEYCEGGSISIERSAFVRNNKAVRLFPNFFSEIGVFLISRE